MLRKGPVLSVLLFPLALLSAASAGAAPLGQGAVELQVGSSFSHNSYSYQGETVLRQTTLALGLSGGDFLTDRLEIGGGVAAVHSFLDEVGVGSASQTSFGLSGNVTFNFPAGGNLVPFVGLAVGPIFYSGDGLSSTEATLILPSVQVGVRQMVGNSASVNFGLSFAHQLNALGVKDLNGNQLALTIGMSIYPRTAR